MKLTKYQWLWTLIGLGMGIAFGIGMDALIFGVLIGGGLGFAIGSVMSKVMQRDKD